METLQIKDKKFAVSIPEAEIRRQVKRVAEEINRDLCGRKPLFLAILNGSFIFAADLMREITLESQISFVKLASYAGMSSTGEVVDMIGLDADIEYDIYSVQVIADNGVGTVAIDGNVLIKSSNAFIYNGYLAAGSHTISIDVKNGYSADNIVIQVNGQTISGNTFTLSGTPEAGESYVTVTITVSGTEATVQEPVVEEDGMGITDYLLIILVILARDLRRPQDDEVLITEQRVETSAP